jgi:hypothetical protein
MAAVWEVQVSCSSARCTEEWTVWVDDLEEIDREVCSCGHNAVVAAIAVYRPVLRPAKAG